jgi:hypothetical protein
MDKLSWEKLETFVKEYMTGPAPVFWLLDTDRFLRRDQIVADQGFDVRRYVGAGVFDVSFAERGLNFSNEFVATLLGGEARGLFRNYESGYSGVNFIIETEVPRSSRSDSPLPVLGPGGRIVVFGDDRGGSAEVTVRRRLDTKEGSWRDPDEITARLRLLYYNDNNPAPLLRAAFGYFELSKYERQKLMRPVFVFALEQPQNEERGLPGWRTTTVEPATVSPDFTLEEGIDNWMEQMD